MVELSYHSSTYFFDYRRSAWFYQFYERLSARIFERETVDLKTLKKIFSHKIGNRGVLSNHKI